MRGLLTFAAILLFTSTAIPGSRTTIDGSLTGETGASIRGAYVLLHDFTASPVQGTSYASQNWETRTGSDGLFSFNVQAGCYDVFVSATWFHPHSERVCVQDGGNIKLNLKLKTSRQAMLRVD